MRNLTTLHGVSGMETPLRILHLEDEPDFCLLVRDVLTRDGLGCELDIVGDLGEFDAALEKSRFDIILADYNLPTCTGIEALEQAARRCPYTPFVLVSGAIGEEFAVEALKRGATDYVLKQRPERLAPVIRRAIQEARTRARLNQAQAQSEQALQASELRFRSLFENMLEGFAYCRILMEGDQPCDFTYVAVNAAFERLTGLKDVVGKRVTEVIPGIRESNPEIFEIYGRVALSSQPERFETYVPALGIWFSTSVYSQEKGYFAAVFDNVTVRKQADAKLQLQGAALESAANAIVITDRKGQMTWANAAFSRLTGYTLEEVLGRKLSFLKSGKHDAAYYRHLWETVLAGCVWHSEMINRHKDGHLYTEEATITPVRDEHAEISHFIAVKQDISERKRAEQELQQTHQQLLAASRQAAIAEFATGILHNVGNVLNSVGVASNCLAESLRKSKSAGLAQVVALLREHETNLSEFLTNNPKGKLVPAYLSQLAEKLAAEQAAALQEMAQLQKGIEHIKSIVIVQQDSAKGSTVPEMLKLTDLVDDALKMSANAIARGKIQVAKDLAETSDVMVPKHTVLQILINLVRNATQACESSDSDPKRLDVCVSRHNDRLRVTVTDNGIGIPSENLPHIFNLGFTTKKNGHGFGLHSCMVAAKEIGGSLVAQSEGPSKGATFTLELPAQPVAASAGALGPTARR